MSTCKEGECGEKTANANRMLADNIHNFSTYVDLRRPSNFCRGDRASTTAPTWAAEDHYQHIDHSIDAFTRQANDVRTASHDERLTLCALTMKAVALS